MFCSERVFYSVLDIKILSEKHDSTKKPKTTYFMCNALSRSSVGFLVWNITHSNPMYDNISSNTSIKKNRLTTIYYYNPIKNPYQSKQ